MWRLARHANRRAGRCARGAGALLLGAALSGCPSQPRVATPDPALLGDDRLCHGSPTDPRAERDPRCAAITTHEPVELVNHLAGCRAGARGPATFRLGDEILATLRPGERRSFMLPRGDVSLTIVEGEHRDTRELSLGGSGPLTIEVGCAPRAFAGRGLQPLVLEGAPAACAGDGAPNKVRAGGLELEVGPGQAYTLFLPRGRHIVKVGGEARTIELGEGGAVVQLAAPCREGR